MKQLCHIGLHEYKLAKREGGNAYYECEYCLRRAFVKQDGTNTPVDTAWLNRYKKEAKK